MGYLFSKSENAFYHTDVHGKNVPSDATEVANAKYAALLTAQANGKSIVGGDDGTPVAIAPQVSDEELAQSAVIRRNTLLNESDCVVLLAYERGEAVPPEWVSYRQALRDLTTQQGFPRKVSWPKKPV